MKGGRVKCIVTGVEKYFTPKALEKRVAKFGTIGQVELHYVSQDAKRLLKQGMTVDEVREKLNVTEKLPKVSLDVLARLKLLKKPKSNRNAKAAQEKAERERYLRSPEYREKMRKIQERRENMTFQEWVVEQTSVGRERGGTCLRPDVFLTYNHKACDGCPYYEHCRCYQRRLSHEKRKPRKKW